MRLRERKREEEREREGEIVKDLKLRSPLRERVYGVCVCVCVSVKERGVQLAMSLSGRPGSQGLTHLMSI